MLKRLFNRPKPSPTAATAQATASPAATPPLPAPPAERRQPAAPAGRPTGSVEVSRDKIAARAYEIWTERGHPPGTEHENWLRAEAELRKKGNRE